MGAVPRWLGRTFIRAHHRQWHRHLHIRRQRHLTGWGGWSFSPQQQEPDHLDHQVRRDSRTRWLRRWDQTERPLRVDIPIDVRNGHERPLSGLIQAWADHVDRFVAERDVDPEGRRRWTPDDFVAALFIHDFVEDGLRGLPRDLVAAAQRVIDRVDATCLEFTVPDSEGLLGGGHP